MLYTDTALAWQTSWIVKLTKKNKNKEQECSSPKQANALMLDMEWVIFTVTVAQTNMKKDPVAFHHFFVAMPPKKTNAVNSVVSDLIRAAAGAGARNVSDEDVDKYVADLILKEAEEKRKKYNQVGVKAYQPDT